MNRSMPHQEMFLQSGGHECLVSCHPPTVSASLSRSMTRLFRRASVESRKIPCGGRSAGYPGHLLALRRNHRSMEALAGTISSRLNCRPIVKPHLRSTGRGGSFPPVELCKKNNNTSSVETPEGAGLSARLGCYGALTNNALVDRHPPAFDAYIRGNGAAGALDFAIGGVAVCWSSVRKPSSCARSTTS